MNPPTPLRKLVKSHAEGLITRDQYLDIRNKLLKKLDSTRQLQEEDLKNFMQLYQNEPKPGWLSGYSASDWTIILLGILAAIMLGFILFQS